MKQKRSLTLGQLVEAIQDNSASDAEAVAILNHMLNTGRVTLCAGDISQDGAAPAPKPGASES